MLWKSTGVCVCDSWVSILERVASFPMDMPGDILVIDVRQGQRLGIRREHHGQAPLDYWYIDPTLVYSSPAITVRCC